MSTKDKGLQVSKNKKTYRKILSDIQQQITLTQNEIFKTITRKKVEMAWQIGRIVDEAIVGEREKDYGKHLIEKLEGDVLISRKVLYKMRSFYQKYPQLPKDDPQLNWSHYRVLSGVKEEDERKLLEDLVRENLLDSDDLQKEVSKRKALSDVESPPIKKSGATKITPNRGVIFTYKITQLEGSEKNFIDCGFKIFRETQEKLPSGAKVVLVKEKNGQYSFKKSAASEKEVYLYKAYLKRVVDGDTIHANIDLGFGMWHEEILRLAQINSEESKSDSGKNATEELKKIFASTPFFIVKSIKTDIYNRYVADIFLPKKNETDLQKIADEGTYLNQLLLDRGLVQVF